MKKYTLLYAINQIFPYDHVRGYKFECEGVIFESLENYEWYVKDLDGMILEVPSMNLMIAKQREGGKNKDYIKKWFLRVKKYGVEKKIKLKNQTLIAQLKNLIPYLK